MDTGRPENKRRRTSAGTRPNATRTVAAQHAQRARRTMDMDRNLLGTSQTSHQRLQRNRRQTDTDAPSATSRACRLTTATTERSNKHYTATCRIGHGKNTCAEEHAHPYVGLSAITSTRSTRTLSTPHSRIGHQNGADGRNQRSRNGSCTWPQERAAPPKCTAQGHGAYHA